MNKIFFCIVLAFSLNNILLAQDISNAKHKFEIQAIYSLQRPFYSAEFLLPKQYRFRSELGGAIRYYIFRKLYAQYLTSYSQQGGGFKTQYTNANYWKNSLCIGFSSKHSRKTIFEFGSGLELNILINAKFKNTVTRKKENVSDYFNRSFLSVPISFGIKRKITTNTYVTCGTFISMSSFKVSGIDEMKIAQFIVPAIQLKLSKFLQ